MRKITLLFGAILALSISAHAQDLPKFDVFGGYSYVHFNLGSNSGNITSSLNGGTGAVAFYPSKWLGFVGDFGDYRISTFNQGSVSIPVHGNVISYLGGPRIRFASGRVTPFAQVLFGGAHSGDITTNDAGVCGEATPPCTISNSSNAFAMTTEGGIDIKVARHFAIRSQGGYLMTRFKPGTQNNARISVGIVIE